MIFITRLIASAQGGLILTLVTNLKTDSPTSVVDGHQQVLVDIALSDQFVSQPVVDVQQVVGVFACIMLHLCWQWSVDGGYISKINKTYF